MAKKVRIYLVGDNLQDMENGDAFTNHAEAVLASIDEDCPIGYVDVDNTDIHYLED